MTTINIINWQLLMSSKIPFEFDISVSADKKRRAKNKGSSGAFEGSSHKCDVVGCELIGKYRAPKSPKNVEEFNWFCLKHVKEYNNCLLYTSPSPRDS